MRIERQGFIIRDWMPNDCSALAEAANNINIWNNLRDGFPHPYTFQDGVNFVNMVNEKLLPYFAIEVEGKASGGIGITPQNDVERVTAEFGYWLAEPHWGKGIMTEAAKAMVQYAFDNFDVIKLFAGVFEHNIASVRVLEKAGFVKEAVLRKAAIKNAKVIDLHYYSIFR